MARYDLHMHSNCSDGTLAPSELVYAAAEAGVQLMALTDHDGMDGVAEAQEAGPAAGVHVLAGVEFDCAWPHELHLLGLDLDAGNALLTEALAAARARRETRNDRILAQLKAAGYDIAPYLYSGGGSVTRLHIALALKDAGYADSVRDAFMRFLEEGRAGYVPGFRESCIPPAEAIRVIHAAGGLAVWAHPMHARANLHTLTRTLKDAGLDGIEAYHPSASEGESELLVSLAAQHGLYATCGSDFHGANRPGVAIGCTWRDCAPLNETYRYFCRD